MPWPTDWIPLPPSPRPGCGPTRVWPSSPSSSWPATSTAVREGSTRSGAGSHKLGAMATAHTPRPGRPPCVLSIAGSDSGGGAGIQADLKAFAACGVHSMTAITAITAQNTVGVTALEAVSPELIVAQVRGVAQDIGVGPVKVGMLGTTDAIQAVARALDELQEGRDRVPVVLDPVMVSESGARLLEAAAQQALMELLLPRAQVVTPNLPEARALATTAAGTAVADDDPAGLARAIRALGPEVVVVTGGHREQAIDAVFVRPPGHATP